MNALKFNYMQCEQSKPIQKFYFSRKGNSIHLFVYDQNKQRTLSKSVNVLFGKGKLKNTPEDFDNQTHKFPKKLKNAETDNKVIEHWENTINVLLETIDFNSAKELLQQIERENNTPIVAQHIITLIEHAQTIYRENNERNSSNKYIYSKFINKLIAQKKNAQNRERIFADIPVSSINTNIYKDWEKYLDARPKLGKRDSMNAFRHVVYDYHHRIIGNSCFSFNHCYTLNLRPKNKKNGKQETLTPQQLEQLKSLNVSNIQLCTKKYNTDEAKTMLLNVALLMYYTFSRPYDILLFDIANFQYNKDYDCWCWRYAPHKKGEHAAICEIPIICDEALKIVEKYKGKRKKGYLFPYLENTKGDIYVTRNKITMAINELLQKAAQFYNWGFKPTMYTLRHTQITNSVAKGMPINLVADLAQTSVREINSTYYDKKTAALRGFNNFIKTASNVDY